MTDNSEDPGRAPPFHAPPYGPTWECKDFRRISVVCEVDPVVLQRVLEKTPFSPTSNRIEIFHDDLSRHTLGAFNESGICFGVEFNAMRGMFHAVVFVTNDVALMAGREVFGYPKLGGEVEYREDGSKAFGETRRNGNTIMNVSVDVTGEPCSLSDMVRVTDSREIDEWEWTHHLLLKSIPRADRPGADTYSVIYRNIRAQPTSIVAGNAAIRIEAVPELRDFARARPLAAYLIKGDFGGGWTEDRRVLQTLHETEVSEAVDVGGSSA